jgi:hypothetical protein
MSSCKFINSCVPDEKYIILYETFTINDLCEVKEIMTKNKIVNIICYCSISLLNNFNFENVPIEKITCKSRQKSHYGTITNFNNLPKNLLILDLSESEYIFDKFDNLPTGLKKLMLPYLYCYELDNLPISLEYLLVQPNILSQCNLAYLPEGLKTLVIKIHGDYINFDNLPNGLEKLEIEGILADNVSLENLPRKLKTLHLPNYLYVQGEDPNVRERSQYNKSIVNLPQGLEELRVSIEYAYLNETLRTNSEKPIKIKKLIIGHYLSKSFTGIRTYKTIDFHTIPDYVEELELSDNFNDIIKYIPPGIKKLKFGSSFNKKIEQNVIPDTMEEMEFGYSYNYTISKYPSNLKVLIFGRNFSSNLTNLPSELMRLELGEKFQAKLTNLPKKLKIIKFNELGEFKDDLKLPENLEILCLSSNYKGKLLNVPKSLRQIKFSTNSNPKLLEQLNNANYTGDIVDVQM